MNQYVDGLAAYGACASNVISCFQYGAFGIGK